MKVSVLKGFAGLGVRLAVLSVFMLGMAGIAHAQASGAAAQANPKPAAAATGQGKAEPATVAPGKSPAKGNHEGITVHGRWMIEVRNPDGKVVSHTEFENSLVGATLLGDMLTGVIVPGGYQVSLHDSPTGTTGPCQPLPNNSSITECVLVGSLISPTPTTFADLNIGCGLPASPNGLISALGPCFPLTIAANSTGFTVTGTATSYVASDTITDVYLGPLTCGTLAAGSVAAVSPSTCAGGNTTVQNYLTHGSLPTPGVAITAVGQSIFVSVQISFASGT
jgi:hypothetical protein